MDPCVGNDMVNGSDTLRFRVIFPSKQTSLQRDEEKADHERTVLDESLDEQNSFGPSNDELSMFLHHVVIGERSLDRLTW